MKEIEPKRSAASWLAELAKGRYGEYALSVLTALLGVARLFRILSSFGSLPHW